MSSTLGNRDDPRTPRNNRSSITTHQTGAEQVDAIISIMRSKMRKVKKLQVGKNDGFTAYDNALMQVEEVQLGKKTKLVRKIYVLTGPYKVGWVVDIDVDCCMICLHRWSWTRFRHHCRACGKLVCSKCSPFTVRLPNFEEEDGSRVCVECFGLKPSADSIVESSGNGSAILTSPLAPGDTMSTKAHGLVRRKDGSIVQKGGNNTRPSRKALMSRQTQQLMDEFQDDPVEVLERLEEEQRQLFAAEQLPKNKEAYRTMRCCIPAQITRTNYSSLRTEFEKVDLGDELADRIWNHKILWLICMHPDDLQKIHIADLRTKYAFTGLDLVEMRAIAYVLPKQWDSTRESRRQALLVSGNTVANAAGVNNLEELENQQVATESANNLAQKRQWKASFDAKLEELIRKEEIGTLLPGQARNPVYEEMEWREIQVFDPDVPIKPIFYRGASFRSDAVYETPPPPGSTLSVIQRQGQRQDQDLKPESSDLDGFSILTPPGKGHHSAAAAEYHGRCFDDDDDTDMLLLSPKTPEYAGTDSKKYEYDSPSPSARLNGNSAGDIDAGVQDSNLNGNEDPEHWDIHISGDDIMTSPLASASHTGASETKGACTPPVSTVSQVVSQPGSAGANLSPWTDVKIAAAMSKIEAEEQENEKKSEMDAAQIEAAMLQIEQEEARQRELEAEMEKEMERSREEEKKRREEILRKAASTYEQEVSKATRRASLNTLNNSSTNNTSVGSVVLTPVPGVTDTPVRITYTTESDMVINQSTSALTNAETELVVEPPSENSPIDSPAVDFDIPELATAGVKETAFVTADTPTLSSPNTSTESEQIDSGHKQLSEIEPVASSPAPAVRQRELEAEMEKEMERSREEEKKRREEILRKARDVHKEQMGRAVRRASAGAAMMAMKPALPSSQIKVSTFDDFNVTPTRGGDSDSEESTPIASDRLF